ncbi:uncharacterized protein LOC123697918 isoform X2 [Colias croceus]|uniref:uncharacterized protein LOC123697918 isoform X2 n=1 Tax=Colias crocea TaxID=72248 RepID=UPI001E27F2F5|nr:uncharacterized protein LOC123697918 isoform X2 [Colias croceus]
MVNKQNKKKLKKRELKKLRIEKMAKCRRMLQCLNAVARENLAPKISDVETTLNLSKFVSDSQSMAGSEEDEVVNDPLEDIVEISNLDEPMPSCSSTSIVTQESTTSRKRNLPPRFTEKRQKMFDVNSVTREDFLKLCNKYLTTGMSQIIKWQMESKANIGMDRHSDAFKLFALSVYYTGPAAYNFFKNTLRLPSAVALKTFVKPIGTRLDDRLLSVLKTKVDKMVPQERICSVCVDSMPLRPNLMYNIKYDRIVGLHEINGCQNGTPANYGIVIMVRGIVHRWKQPIAHSFLSNIKDHEKVNNWIEQIIKSLLSIGLDVRVFISNLDTNLLLPSKTIDVNTGKTYFEMHGKKIYYMFNVPHLLKLMLNEFMEYDIMFNTKVAKWSHIRDLYSVDKKQQTKLVPQLSEHDINTNHGKKLSLKVAHSRSVASAILKYVDLKLIEAAAKDTAEFINRMSDFFDLFHSSKMQSAHNNKTVFTGERGQIGFLEEMIIFFRTLRVGSFSPEALRNNMFFLYGLQVSIKSLLLLHKDLKLEDIHAFATNRLNLNSVHNFFDKVKKANDSSEEPTCRHFNIAFTEMFVNKILRKLVVTNSNDDFEISLIASNNCSMFDTSKVSSNVNMGILAVGTKDYKFDLPKKNGLVYISCYLFRKCLEQHKCDKMNSVLNITEENLEKQTDSDVETNKSSSDSIFLSVPPKNFMSFIEELEKKFLEYFDDDLFVTNIGNDLCKHLGNCTFVMPCDCFPLEFLIKLFIRLRLFHSINKHNNLIQKKHLSHVKFMVSRL